MELNHTFRRRFRLAIGCVLLFAGLFGTWYSVRAARAQQLYLRTKYGYFRGTGLERPRETNATEAARVLQRARELYPDNYYFPAYVAWLQVDAMRQARDWEQFNNARDAALYFGREAVSINPYNSESRYAWVRALDAAERRNEAIEYWRGIVELEYWMPDLHQEYVRLLLRQGASSNLVEAAKERVFIRDAALRRRLDRMARLFGLP